VDTKITVLKGEFQDAAKKMFNEVEKKLKNHLEKADKLTEAIDISEGFVSLRKRKRIVGVNKSIDNNDVVIREELSKLQKKVFDISKPTTPETHGSLDIKDHRKISKVSKATEPYDVVVKAQLDESVKQINTKIQKLVDEFKSFKSGSESLQMSATSKRPDPLTKTLLEIEKENPVPDPSTELEYQ